MPDGDDLASEYEFRAVGRYRAELGESPFLSHDGVHIWWVDTLGKRLLRTHRNTGVEQIWTVPEQVGFVAEAWNTCIVGMESGLFEFDPVRGKLNPVPNSSPGPGMRYNDACVDAEGRLWAGTMALGGERPSGALYCFRALSERRTVDTGYRRINGLAHDAANSRLWLSDSHPDVRSIWSLDLRSTNMAASRTEIMKLTANLGRPDGAFIDADGRYWVATLEGRSILHPEPNGRSVPLISLPMRLPTKAAVDGQGRLYVTSKRSVGDHLGGLLLVGTRSMI